MSASPPTALSAVFRRITDEMPALPVAPEAPLFDEYGLELCGFEEPVLYAPEPAEPAAEDILALLAEQPEVAPFVDVHNVVAEAEVVVARLEPGPKLEPEPTAEDVLAPRAEPPEALPPADVHVVEIEEVVAEPPPSERELVPELPPEPEPQASPPFDALPPEAPPSPRQALIARFSSRFIARPSIPAVTRTVPEPAPVPVPEVVDQPDPVPSIPPMPSRTIEALPQPSIELPPEPPVEAPLPLPVEAPPLPDTFRPSALATDRNGRHPPSRNRRLYRRVQLGAEIEIDGVLSSLIDVSIGGFAATGVDGLVANTIVPVSLRLTIDGIEVGTQVHARIIYTNRERSSGRFIDLTASQTAFLRYIVTWRGESVGTVGTTTLLDAITGGPLHGFPPKNAQESRERWWHGMIGRKIQPPR